MKRALIIFITLAMVLSFVSCGGSGTSNEENKSILNFTDKNSDTDKNSEFKNFLESGEYEKAAELYRKNTEDIDIVKFDANVKKEANTVMNDFKSGKITLEAATEKIDILLNISSANVYLEISETSHLLDSIKKSQNQFNNGEISFNAGNYVEAKEYYCNVIEADPLYSEARKKIIECEAKYKESLLDAAKSYADNGDYNGAAEYLTQYLYDFSDNTALQIKINEYKALYEDAVIADKLKETNSLVNMGNFYDAVIAIGSVFEEYPKNEKVIALKADVENKFIKKQTDVIDKYISEEKYTEAYSVCKSALELLPTSEELKSRMEIIEPLKPVLLSELKISEYNNFYICNDTTSTYIDTIGNTYNPYNLYGLRYTGFGSGTKGYAKLFLNSQYLLLNGIIAVDDDSNILTCTVKILADNEVIFSGTFDRATPPKNISLDVTGKQWIEFNISSDKTGAINNFYIFLAGFEFTR